MSKKAFITLFLIILCDSTKTGTQCPNLKADIRSLRRRRGLAFPDGSTLVITADLAKTFQTHVPSGWYVTMDIDLIFHLPDEEFRSALLRRKLHHRQKREVWTRIMDALYMHNFDGYVCLLRTICEAKQYLAPPGKSLVHDVLRIVFSAPVHEEHFREEMADLYEELADPKVCDKKLDCPFSIIQFISLFNKSN